MDKKETILFPLLLIVFAACCTGAPSTKDVYSAQEITDNGIEIDLSKNDVQLNTFPIIYEEEALNGNIETVIIADLSNVQNHKSKDDNSTPKEDESTSFDSWSIVWYIASFGGLIAFFLIVSCSEWCCRRPPPITPAQDSNITSGSRPNTPEVPPPAYELFAPPPYDTCFITKDGEKREFDVYVVPVHSIRTGSELPPAYAAINVRTIAAQAQNTPT